LFQNWISAG